MAGFTLVPLCEDQPVALKDGQTGANAFIPLPFYGNWYANGQTYVYANSEIPQDSSLTLGGITMPNTFMKSCCQPHA